MQRKLAASIQMTHTITMDFAQKTFRLQEKGGPVDSDTTYVIDGPEMTTLTMKTQFVDKVSWTDDGKIKIRKLKLPEQNYELVLVRSLEDDKKGGHPTLVVVSMHISTNICNKY